MVTPSPAHGGPQEFVTSDQCSGCHDATGTLAGVTPNMIFQASDGTPVNLSEFGEWRYSMMGLSGRDPVFFAQLDTESTLHKHLAGKADGAAFVENLCLRCHGVMGQRQFHIDNPGPDKLFTRKMLQDPKSRYGALARDGVSCDTCHHIPGQLFGPSTYSGLFEVGPPGELYGPYSPQATIAMKNAIGVLPTFSRTVRDARALLLVSHDQVACVRPQGSPGARRARPARERIRADDFFRMVEQRFLLPRGPALPAVSYAWNIPGRRSFIQNRQYRGQYFSAGS